MREERRFREAALLAEATGTLVVESRFPLLVDGEQRSQAKVLRLSEPDIPSASVWDDFRDQLDRAISQCLHHDEFLVVERGGWDAPTEPFCLFIALAEDDDDVIVIETTPAPYGSQVWEPHIVADRSTDSLSAPASADTVAAAPLLIMDAIGTWGLEPWDLALTFGGFDAPGFDANRTQGPRVPG